MEKVAQAFARNNPTAVTTVSTVRYGNVMMSRGSVIPLFVEQVRSGRPVTVTDPHMTRFLMSLDDAVMLVEHAFGHARPGDLFIRKAPACTVETLAFAVARALGAEPQISVIGTRHGEKLYETLATREELTRGGGPGGLLPGQRGRARPQLRQVLRGRRRLRVGQRGLPLPQHPAPRGR